MALRTWLPVSLGIGALATTAGVFLADSFAHRVAGVIGRCGLGQCGVDRGTIGGYRCVL